MIHKNHKSLFSKSATALLIAGTVFLVILCFNELRRGNYIGATEDTQNTISISGTGEATAIPNAARFTVGVTNEAESVSAAQAQSTEAINNIISYLREANIADENIKTVNYDISPRYDYVDENGIVVEPPNGERELTGYEVSQRLEVTTNDTATAGELLSGVGERGADSISSLSFVVNDEAGLERAAEANAISNARQNARRLARSLGVDLVRVVGYNETGGVQPLRLEAAQSLSADSSAGTPEIPAGENRIETSVEIIYEIN